LINVCRLLQILKIAYAISNETPYFRVQPTDWNTHVEFGGTFNDAGEDDHKQN
jgi:hypothetical protein